MFSANEIVAPAQRLSGPMLKRGPKQGSKWQTRFVELYDREFAYFKEQGGKELGSFRLAAVTSFWSSGGNDAPKPELMPFAFALDVQQADRSMRTFNFCLWTHDQYAMWVGALTQDLASQAIPVHPRVRPLMGPVAPVASPRSMRMRGQSTPEPVSPRPGRPPPPAQSPQAFISGPYEVQHHGAGEEVLREMQRTKAVAAAPAPVSPVAPVSPGECGIRRNTATAAVAPVSSVSPMIGRTAPAPPTVVAPTIAQSTGSIPLVRRAPLPATIAPTLGESAIGPTTVLSPPPVRSPVPVRTQFSSPDAVVPQPQALPPPPLPSKRSALPAMHHSSPDLLLTRQLPQPAAVEPTVAMSKPVPRPPVGAVKIKKVATGKVPPLPQPPAKKGVPAVPAPPAVSTNSADAYHYMRSAEVDSAEIMSTTFAATADGYEDNLMSGDALETPNVGDLDGDCDTQELAQRLSEAPMAELRIAIQEYLPEDAARCLPLQPGDRLTVLTVEDDWAYGSNQDDCQGYFPLSFTVPV